MRPVPFARLRSASSHVVKIAPVPSTVNANITSPVNRRGTVYKGQPRQARRDKGSPRCLARPVAVRAGRVPPLFVFDAALPVNANPLRAAVEVLVARSHLTLATHPRFTGRRIVDDMKARLVHMIRKVRRLDRPPRLSPPLPPAFVSTRPAWPFPRARQKRGLLAPILSERTHSLPRHIRTSFRVLGVALDGGLVTVSAGLRPTEARSPTEASEPLVVPPPPKVAAGAFKGQGAAQGWFDARKLEIDQCVRLRRRAGRHDRRRGPDQARGPSELDDATRNYLDPTFLASRGVHALHGRVQHGGGPARVTHLSQRVRFPRWNRTGSPSAQGEFASDRERVTGGGDCRRMAGGGGARR